MARQNYTCENQGVFKNWVGHGVRGLLVAVTLSSTPVFADIEEARDLMEAGAI